MKNKNTQHNCPICGKYLFMQDNSFDICKYCGWENEDYYDGGQVFPDRLPQGRRLLRVPRSPARHRSV